MVQPYFYFLHINNVLNKSLLIQSLHHPVIRPAGYPANETVIKGRIFSKISGHLDILYNPNIFYQKAVKAIIVFKATYVNIINQYVSVKML